MIFVGKLKIVLIRLKVLLRACEFVELAFDVSNRSFAIVPIKFIISLVLFNDPLRY